VFFDAYFISIFQVQMNRFFATFCKKLRNCSETHSEKLPKKGVFRPFLTLKILKNQIKINFFSLIISKIRKKLKKSW